LSDIAYIDASAFVKLFAPEPESAAIAAMIAAEWSNLVASEILAVEASRAAVRIGGGAPALASRFLSRVVLLPLSPQVRERACRVGAPELRALDAIHLATALSQDTPIDAIFTYDKRLGQAGADAGLRVLAPA
jgi:predicted nucleic acid-binding protein